MLSSQNGNQLAPKARIVDFDLAIPITYDESSKVKPITIDVCFTQYAPPEFYTSERVDPTKKDMWSLGAVFYYLMSRRHLFSDHRTSLKKALLRASKKGMSDKTFKFTKDLDKIQIMAPLVDILQALLQPKAQERLTPEEFLQRFGPLLPSNRPRPTSSTQLPGVPQPLSMSPR
jgi:serine/threonine protein kinase